MQVAFWIGGNADTGIAARITVRNRLRGVSVSLPVRKLYRPNIPGIDGMPIRPPPAIFFIIFCISRN